MELIVYVGYEVGIAAVWRIPMKESREIEDR